MCGVKRTGRDSMVIRERQLVGCKEIECLKAFWLGSLFAVRCAEVVTNSLGKVIISYLTCETNTREE